MSVLSVFIFVAAFYINLELLLVFLLGFGLVFFLDFGHDSFDFFGFKHLIKQEDK